METLFSSLAIKCLNNGLRFEFIPESSGVIVMDDYKVVASGWMDKEPVKELKAMHYFIDRHIGGGKDANIVRTQRQVS